jgi:chloramphenicol-sensitive protein RarD
LLSGQAIGLQAAFVSYLLWGALPLYFHLLGPAVSPWGILAHRILWSAAMLCLATVLLRRLDRLRVVFTTPTLLGPLMASAALVVCNWGVFIWAVVNDHVIDASLGYFINPLLSIALGFFLLGERMRGLQWVAVTVAAAGVVFSVIAYGRVPWIGLILACCFGLYGLIRKQIAVDSMTGLLVETLLMSPFAAAGLGWLYAQHKAAFLTSTVPTDLLLIGCGAMTFIPFTLFAVGVRRLQLRTIGLMQYLTPTLQFLSGAVLLHETLSTADKVTFACIWAALGLYTISLLGTRRSRAQSKPNA